MRKRTYTARQFDERSASSSSATSANLLEVATGPEQVAGTPAASQTAPDDGPDPGNEGLQTVDPGLTGRPVHDGINAGPHRARSTALFHHRLTDSPEGAPRPVTAGQPVREALCTGIAAFPPLGRGNVGNEHDHLMTVFRHAVEQPADAGLLARFAPNGDSVACVTGVLLGAVHGIEALPVDLVSRHELSWVLGTLACDLLIQILDSPSGSEYVEGWDPHWWSRRPGW
ncbi:hypothetical protein [Streptomyces sp. NPDC059787]|uniref:hypothetical protein n=1 Tax=Streptomyces sp. NPDC059787 TaxID=3346947 RepID=UPI003649A3DE